MFFFPHVYSPRQGQTTHWWQKFDDNRKAFSLCPYVASFKMISSKSDFIHIFNDFIHVYSPGARAGNPLGTNFWCQQKALITSTICCKFQTNLFEFWFYTHILMFFYIWGQNPDVNRKALSLCPFVASFKTISLKSDFIHNFCLFLYMYIAPEQGQTTLSAWGQNFYINIKLLSLWSFAVSFFH